MCGIAGATWRNPHRSIDSRQLDRMTDVLQHRGPDGRGTYYEQYESGLGVALGHRRLAIIDIEGGKQPISNEDGTVWITFNGEIYNYRELRTELESCGHHFRTDSDTETIVHLYEEHGTKCLEKLRGMFAFAIWDERQNLMMLARDRMGQKPLVYRHVDGQLLFGSEIKSILQVPSVRREVDPDALNLYLSLGYVPHPWTMFRGINKLPPAHFAIYKSGKLSIERYWQPDWNLESSRPMKELQEELRSEMIDAIQLQLRSDVPIGAFLSGGIDSTTIVALMQGALPHPAKTFTMGFPVNGYDETKYARQAANHLGTEHQELHVDPGSISLLPTLTWHFDEPFGDSSAMPTYELAQGTRSHVKVALTGDGGDELFGGYSRYQTIQQLGAFDRLPAAIRKAIASPAWQMLPGSDGHESFLSRLRFRMRILRQSADTRYINWMANLHDAQRQKLFTNEFQAQITERPESVLEQAFGVSKRSAGSRAMMCDLQTYLPGDLLAKVDITSMAHGLECRSPFMDHRIVELALSIPFKYHMDRTYLKPMLTRTFSDRIPDSLLRRRKRGFCVPLDEWFREPLRSMAHNMLLSGSAPTRGYFRTEGIHTLLSQHASGKWNHGEKIWALICLEQWHRDYIDRADAPAAPPSVVKTSTSKPKHLLTSA